MTEAAHQQADTHEDHALGDSFIYPLGTPADAPAGTHTRAPLTVLDVIKGLCQLISANPDASDIPVTLNGCDCSQTMSAIRFGRYQCGDEVTFERTDQ